jgi:uncharacterized OsmC-like protein
MIDSLFSAAHALRESWSGQVCRFSCLRTILGQFVSPTEFLFIELSARATQRSKFDEVPRRRGMGMVNVRPLDQKRLLGVAGHHAIVTDRKPDEGGSDVGCTSGELLLLAIGSCATGQLRKFLWATDLPTDGLEVDVNFEPSPIVGDRDSVAIDIHLPMKVLDGRCEDIMTAAQSGRVVSRLRLGSRLVVRCLSADGPSASVVSQEISVNE